MQPSEIEIRDIVEFDELHACEELQKHAWGFSCDRDVIPLTQLIAARKAGGILLGAFDTEAAMLAFCYGFLGRLDDGRLMHYSQMTAVRSDLRDSGLGTALKWAQRDVALEQGLELMCWTYDPLESLNGYFNFGKLGVVAQTYWPNMYGDTTSPLHQGTPTDRFRADWYLSASRVAQRRSGNTKALVERLSAERATLPSALDAVERDGVEWPGEPRLALDEARLLCEIPRSIQAIKATDREAALAWRAATRAVLVGYFDRGYHARECFSTPPDANGQRRTYYLLELSDPEVEPGADSWLS